MRGRHHLGKVDDRGSVIRVQENVEFVEVAVNKTKAGQLDYQFHEYTVERGGVSYIVDLAAAVRGRETGQGRD